MIDPKLIKQWKVTRVHLDAARRLLPSPLLENTGEIPNQDMGTLAAYEDSLDHNELELALDQLEGLGDLNPCRGGFWKNLEKAARSMRLDDRAKQLERKFHEALIGQRQDG